ncbi:MAG: 6-phospho-beta-glucosidase [Deltaproteobacteria bacterium]|nr:6-phospho-beta-glucosidase [Deltaproteobacteria bacterium]
MSSSKVAVIGGGSTYTPELLDGLMRHAADLDLAQVVLADPDEERLAVVGGFCRRMLQAAGSSIRLETTGSNEEAIEGASFVLTQIRVGGQAGRHLDIQLGLTHGLVGQETTGVGGFAKAMRTVPVMLGLCEEMEKRCPKAWLINFTNPSGLVTEAILKYGRERAIGLCNNPINLHLDSAKLLDVDPGRLQLDYIGLNHLSWVRRILVDGRDVLPGTLAQFASAGRPANIPDELDYPDAFLQALGAIPCSYLRYFYRTREVVAELKAKTRSRAEEVMEVEEELLAQYRNPALTQKPEALSKRGGANYSRAAVDLMRSIATDSGARHVVNVRNGSCLASLPSDCVVEVGCQVGADGATPLALEEPAPEIRGLMQHVKAYEELAVEAAVKGDRATAILALVSHPLVADVDLAVLLVDEIAGVHKLPWSVGSRNP